LERSGLRVGQSGDADGKDGVNSGIRRTGLLIEVVEVGFGVVEGNGGGLSLQGVNSIAREILKKINPFIILLIIQGNLVSFRIICKRCIRLDGSFWAFYHVLSLVR